MLTVSKEVAVALQNDDKNNVDITDELNNPSIFCETVELEWGRLELTGTVELDREQAGTAKLESEVGALGRVELECSSRRAEFESSCELLTQLKEIE